MGIKPEYAELKNIPTDGYKLVASFAANTDISVTGTVRFKTFSRSDQQTVAINSHIQSAQGVSFTGTWMLVVDWYFVPELDGSTVS